MQEKYAKEAVPAMQALFGYKNVMASPHIVKAVVNIGVGKMREEKDRAEIQIMGEHHVIVCAGVCHDFRVWCIAWPKR
mgnify:CR=1 FL=1